MRRLILTLVFGATVLLTGAACFPDDITCGSSAIAACSPVPPPNTPTPTIPTPVPCACSPVPTLPQPTDPASPA